MATSSKITRRNILQVGLGAAAGMVTGTVFAQSIDIKATCATPSQTEGPFYPRHNQADKDLDLTQIQGHSQRAQGEIIYIS